MKRTILFNQFLIYAIITVGDNMKKIIFILMISLLIVGCGANKTKVLLCQDRNEKYIFKFDNKGYVDRIYYENNILFDNYYTDFEIEEYKENPIRLMYAIEDSIKDCNLEEYACNSSYDNYVIKNKYYLDNKNSASKVKLDSYFGLNKDDVRTRVISNMKNSTCSEVDDSDLYFVKDNKTTIKLDKTYNSIEEMKSDLTKEKYYKKYTLVEQRGNKGTIEFMEDGKCKIDLSDFDEDFYQGSHCEENHKNYLRYVYNEGNCTYKINDYEFIIEYDGTYKYGSFCETHEDSAIYNTKPVVRYKEIKIEFDEDYDTFKFTNGYWQEVSPSSALIFKS